MPDADATQDAIHTLGSEIAKILEDSAPQAPRRNPPSIDTYVAGLISAGEDVATLAKAIGVLHRRREAQPSAR